MLPAKKRLTKKEDFSRTYQKGKVFSGSSIVIKIARSGTSETRLGFSVGKKFFKKAVLRNKGKRMLREALGPYLKDIKPGFDIVAFYKKKETVTGEGGLLKVKKEAEELLKKAGLLKS